MSTLVMLSIYRGGYRGESWSLSSNGHGLIVLTRSYTVRGLLPHVRALVLSG
jgi:hypothetical protein